MDVGRFLKEGLPAEVAWAGDATMTHLAAYAERRAITGLKAIVMASLAQQMRERVEALLEQERGRLAEQERQEAEAKAKLEAAGPAIEGIRARRAALPPQRAYDDERRALRLEEQGCHDAAAEAKRVMVDVYGQLQTCRDHVRLATSLLAELEGVAPPSDDLLPGMRDWLAQ